MPVYWNGGFSLAQLLATNALQFDGNTGIYYKDNSLFRKTQVGIQTGVSVRFFNKSKHPMEIGPQVHYTISNLMKYKFDDSRHILSMGVMAKWYIKK